MKKLELRKTLKKNGFTTLYEVIENGKVIATRTSNREYAACHVFDNGNGTFYAGQFYGRLNLVKPCKPGFTPYALATVNS